MIDSHLGIQGIDNIFLNKHIQSFYITVRNTFISIGKLVKLYLLKNISLTSWYAGNRQNVITFGVFFKPKMTCFVACKRPPG